MHRHSEVDRRVDEGGLARLLARGRASGSDAIVIVVGGVTAAAEYFGTPMQPIELMSCTKSVVSLLVGMLIDDGSIASVDEPIATWFPPWRRTAKAAVSVRHLLTHASGLRADRVTAEIYASDDVVQLALDAPLVDRPGTRFFYNNKAVNLLAGVIERASGMRMDRLARERLFAPLAIDEFHWVRDRAGTPHAMSGLQLHAADLARVGRLVCQGGRWGSRQIVSRAWLEACTRPAFPHLGPEAGRYGYLWWLGDQDEVDARRGAVDCRAHGYLGNHLVICSRRRLVAVRQRRAPRHRTVLEASDNFDDFPQLARAVVSPAASTPDSSETGQADA